MKTLLTMVQMPSGKSWRGPKIGFSSGLNMKTLPRLGDEARLETIGNDEVQHDLIVRATSRTHGLRRLSIGFLAEDVARKCRKPMLMMRRE